MSIFSIKLELSLVLASLFGTALLRQPFPKHVPAHFPMYSFKLLKDITLRGLTNSSSSSSNPSSPNYGKHYSPEEVHDLFAPHKNTVDSVRTWLEAAGIDPSRLSQSTNKQWLQFDAETAELEELIKADFHHYEHLPTGKTNIGCDE